MLPAEPAEGRGKFTPARVSVQPFYCLGDFPIYSPVFESSGRWTGRIWNLGIFKHRISRNCSLIHWRIHRGPKSGISETIRDTKKSILRIYYLEISCTSKPTMLLKCKIYKIILFNMASVKVRLKSKWILLYFRYLIVSVSVIVSEIFVLKVCLLTWLFRIF